jgi:hypothetical protein
MFDQLKTALTCTGPPEGTFFAVPCRHPHTGQPARSEDFMAVPVRPRHEVPGTMGMTVCLWSGVDSVVNQITERKDVCQAALPGYWKHAV